MHFIAQGHWLLHRFPEGRYADVAELCRSVSVAEIEANDWRLTPGRYVRVAAEVEVEENEEDFRERMAEIRAELSDLSAKSVDLTKKIDGTLAGLEAS